MILRPQSPMPSAEVIGTGRHASNLEPALVVRDGAIGRRQHDDIGYHLRMHVAEDHVGTFIVKGEAALLTLRVRAEVEAAGASTGVKDAVHHGIAVGEGHGRPRAHGDDARHELEVSLIDLATEGCDGRYSGRRGGSQIDDDPTHSRGWSGDRSGNHAELRGQARVRSNECAREDETRHQTRMHQDSSLTTAPLSYAR